MVNRGKSWDDLRLWPGELRRKVQTTISTVGAAQSVITRFSARISSLIEARVDGAGSSEVCWHQLAKRSLMLRAQGVLG